MYECFHCGERAVGWDSDFNPDEYGIEGEGVVHNLTCHNCGAEIQYVVLDEGENEYGKDK